MAHHGPRHKWKPRLMGGETCEACGQSRRHVLGPSVRGRDGGRMVERVEVMRGGTWRPGSVRPCVPA